MGVYNNCLNLLKYYYRIICHTHESYKVIPFRGMGVNVKQKVTSADVMSSTINLALDFNSQELVVPLNFNVCSCVYLLPGDT